MTEAESHAIIFEMYRKHIWGVCFWFLLAPFAHAAEPLRRPIPTYYEPLPVIEAEEPSTYRSNRVQFAAELSMVTPTLVQTGNTQFEKTTGIPVISIAAKWPLFRLGGFQFLSEAKAGFGASTGNFLVTSPGARYYENSRSVWIPASLSFETTYELRGVPFIKPAFAFGGGGQYLSQRMDSGETRSLLTPMVTIHPYLLFLQNSDPNGWFGGFTFGLTRTFGIGPSRVNASSIDMAFLFNL